MSFSGVYGFLYLPIGYTSFDQSHVDAKFDSPGYIPLILITLWTFCFSAGVWTLPWMLLSEVFPFKYVDIFFNKDYKLDTEMPDINL